MRPGDVFFHNDVYDSEGGIGHLPDLCVTLPVFDGDDVVAFVQVFGVGGLRGAAIHAATADPATATAATANASR